MEMWCSKPGAALQSGDSVHYSAKQRKDGEVGKFQVADEKRHCTKMSASEG